MTVRVRTHDSLTAVDAAAWDRCAAGTTLYLSHAWLRSVEYDEAFTPRYVTAEDGDGRLLGGLPAYRVDAGARLKGWYDPYARIAGPVLGSGEPREAFFPCLLAGTRAAYANDVVVDPALGPDEQREVTRALLDGCVAEAERAGARSLAFMYLTPAGRARVADLLPRGTPVVLADADAVLDVTFADFDGYLTALGSRRRRNVRRELRAFDASGCTVEAGRLGDGAPTLAPLLANLQRRYGADADTGRMESYLAAQARWLDDRSVCFVARHGGEAVGFALLYEWQDTLYARVAGFDYERLPAGAAVYFRVTYYEPIRYAIEHRLREVRWGPGAFEAKLLRGARLEPLHSALVVPGADVTGWQDAARRHDEAELARWREEHGDAAAGLATPPRARPRAGACRSAVRERRDDEAGRRESTP